MSMDELKPDTGGLGYLKPETGEPSGKPARQRREDFDPDGWLALDSFHVGTDGLLRTSEGELAHREALLALARVIEQQLSK